MNVLNIEKNFAEYGKWKAIKEIGEGASSR